jgi:predicted metal-dependent HD superfamily phosphohydrolase
MLKKTYIQLLKNYSSDTILIETSWNEIETNYSDKKRYYHTLDHLENLLIQIQEVRTKIEDWDSILFTLYYHDIIYKAVKSDNEEKSAIFATNKMHQIGVPNQIIENCKEQIIATKTHFESPNTDTNYFLDADLSILGQSWDLYSAYYKNVRKEYAIYPDLIYIPGRKKVLNYFLKMGRIFKTNYFYSKFEEQAKYNLQKELETIS